MQPSEQAEQSQRRTFRDPGGTLQVRVDGAFRTIASTHTPGILRFLNHPIATRLVQEGHLIASEIYDSDEEAVDVTLSNQSASAIEAKGSLVLRHPLIPFASYPWEWPHLLWLSAAELTLNIALDLLPEGWTLKDATPLNILFRGVKPVFVDVLSIERADMSRPLWLAYAQFVRTFLLPMLASMELGWPLSAVIMRRDGYEPEEIYRALGWLARIRQPALSAVTLPTLLTKRGAQRATSDSYGKVDERSSDPETNAYVLKKTFQTLRKQLNRVAPAQRSSTWSEYTNNADHYNSIDQALKEEFVSSSLANCKPLSVLDVGCNTGLYSCLALAAGGSVVAIDSDAQAVNRLAARAMSEGLDILPLNVDLAHPTPAAGWENQEYASFLSRCNGQFDVVLMLAVLHHLLLGSQIPLDRIAGLCASLTTQNLILEWVQPDDLKFRQLLRGRDSIYKHITEAAFRYEFEKHFSVVREIRLQNGRILFHFCRDAE